MATPVGLRGGSKMFLSIFNPVIWLAGGAVAYYFYISFYRPSRPSLAPSQQPSSPRPPRRTLNQGLTLIYPQHGSNIATDIDVIAIHGFDTDSSRTWEWKHDKPEDGKPEDNVNWLKHKNMLPREISTARIFTCDWPAPLLESPHFVQKTIDEFARVLLIGILGRNSEKYRNSQQGRTHENNRPIVFIASCLGGLILIRALAIAEKEYPSIANATWGIIFLATPFKGTSYTDIPKAAEKALEIQASINGRLLSKLLELTKRDIKLEKMESDFASFCSSRNGLLSKITTFYETGTTSLPRKIFPFLPDSLSQIQPLVSECSATLVFIPSRIPLDRIHIQMNKFKGPEDIGYKAVAPVIKDLVDRVRKEQLVEKAKAEIRNTYCSGKGLKIERLSGDTLPIDQCYINLAIVQKPNGEAESSSATYSSFSLQGRLEVEPPEEENEITLRKLFEPQRACNGEMTIHRRILIHGRAGVGKTTLCKKIVYEFIYHKLWRDLFDYVLWIPLRRLKEQARLNTAGYNLAHLFLHEYLRNTPERERLAEALETEFRTTKGDRFLFLLDGLDEAPQSSNSDMGRFLEELLNQTNVIVTSRPNASLPKNLQQQSYLRLETFGFSLDQINSYVKVTFNGRETHQTLIQSFLDRHQLIQGLMRIPIQLDALCYTWDGFDIPGNIVSKGVMPDTMTAIYIGIEEKLWKKDALDPNRLGKPGLELESAHWEILKAIDNERNFLELLAFNGMYYDIINFEPTHRQAMFNEYRPSVDTGITLDAMLGRISFLRSSDTPFRESSRNYHFIHLTFQEYFTARYIVRQWIGSKPLEYFELTDQEKGEIDPPKFLKKNKYNARYNVLWRFVAGLLSTHPKAKLPDFFQAIQAEPRDLLGPVHQRLVAHCLTEVPTEHPCRKNLEDELFQWVEFTCKNPAYRKLAPRLAISKAIVDKAVKQNYPANSEFLKSLHGDQSLNEESFWAAASCINNTIPSVRSAALEVFLHRRFTEQHLRVLGKYLRDDEIMEALGAFIGQELTINHFRALESFLKDTREGTNREEALERLKNEGEEHRNEIRVDIQRYGCQLSVVEPYLNSREKRQLALKELETQSTLSYELLRAVAECLKDEDKSVRSNALRVLRGRPDLSDHLLQAVAECLKDEDDYIVISNTLRVLNDWPNLSDNALEAVAVCLRNEDARVRYFALSAFKGRPTLSDNILEAIAMCSKDKDLHVRDEAINVLDGRPTLPDKALRTVAVCFKEEPWLIWYCERGLSYGWPTWPKRLLVVIKECLKDEDIVVQREAENSFLGRPTLLEQVHTVTKRLTRGDYHVQEGVLEILRSRRALSNEFLDAVVDSLGDLAGAAKQYALILLKGQPHLEGRHLDGIVACFGHEQGSDDDEIVEILLSRRALEKIGDVKSLFEFLFNRAFRKHTSWQIINGCSYVTLEQVEYSQEVTPEFENKVRQARNKLGSPS
ncbi:ARM repeat-containing protein [Xylaria grammica]|nr:ARM repeat-containing protein [Xylaria grammica]